jgi:hypothetical protein
MKKTLLLQETFKKFTLQMVLPWIATRLRQLQALNGWWRALSRRAQIWCVLVCMWVLLAACGTLAQPAVTPSKQSPDDYSLPTPTATVWPKHR